MKFTTKFYALILVNICALFLLNYSYAATGKAVSYNRSSRPFFQFHSKNTLFTENTLFQNVQTYSTASSATIDGEIYCTDYAVYTFDFAYDGNGGSYSVYTPGSNANLFINNGRAIRKVSMNLSPGINTFSIVINFNGAVQYGYASLKVDQINGSALGNEPGFVDLVIHGQSELSEPVGGATYHWVCKKCGMVNSTGTSTCVDCGKPRN